MPRSRRNAAKRTPQDEILAAWRGIDEPGLAEQRTLRAEPAGPIVKRLMDELGLENRRAETEILNVWNHSLDPNITAHAQPTGLKKGTLFIGVDSNVWLSELVRYRRQEILDRLQKSFGPKLIVRLSFRVGG